jgi:hypothetical protein
VVGVGVRVQSVTDEIADNLGISPLTSRGNPAGADPTGLGGETTCWIGRSTLMGLCVPGASCTML